MTEEQQVGERLNAIRNELKLTQNIFAQSLGVKQGFINSIIKGKKGIGHRVIINIAKEYKQFSVRWLLTGEGEMYRHPIYYSSPDLGSGIPDKLEDGARVEYARPEGQADIQARIDTGKRVALLPGWKIRQGAGQLLPVWQSRGGCAGENGAFA